MRQAIGSRWFALVDLILVMSCGAIWYFWPQLGGWLIVVATIPWIARIVAGIPPVKITKFDVAFLVFILTAVVAIWATYDPNSGWAKFWLIVASILLYYALAGQPRDNLWIVIGLIALIGASVAVYFLLAYDWQSHPGDIPLIHKAGLWWMNARPLTGNSDIYSDFDGGLIAMFIPFYIVLGMRAWRIKSIPFGLFAFSVGIIAVVGLVMTSSVTAWISLTAALGIWLLWEVSSYLAHITALDRRLLFGFTILVAVLILSITIMQYPGRLFGIVNSLPGSDIAINRLEIAGHTVKLVADFPITGGGLASFPGLYSQYMLITPVYIYGTSYNLFLDLALEQGIFGVLSFLVILGVTVWRLGRGKRYSGVRWAIFASLLVLIIQGIADDPLYANQGTPFLFLSAGITVAVVGSKKARDKEEPSLPIKQNTWLRNGILVGLPLLVFVSFALGGIIFAVWQANLGAVDMARVELQDFPSGEWEDDQNLDNLVPALNNFQKSLSWDDLNFTALYRMGLIALQARDFDLAKSYLESAYRLDMEHRGVRKVLGYCYVWIGEFDRAAELLSSIPEAEEELRAYIGWWARQGRADLSQRAQQMVELL